MHLKNLGQIKDSKISLNDMNIFWGENGTGKTISAYAIFAFQDWFNKFYKVEYLTPEILKPLLLKDNISIDFRSILENISNDAVKKFNSLKPEYFINFFKDNMIFQEGSSKITIDESDIYSLLRKNTKSSGWYNEWPVVLSENSENKNLTNTNVKNILLLNRTFSIILPKINIQYRLTNSDNLTPIINHDIDRKKQISYLLETPSLVSVANASLKNVLFSTSFIYLPAERIGYDVFRRSIKSYRLNYISNNSSIDSSKTKNSLITYPTPIERYMQYINDDLEQGVPSNHSKFLSNLNNKLIDGTFKYDHNTDKVSYDCMVSPDSSNKSVTFDMLSSSLKSLFGLSTILKNFSPDSWVFIDEPEMNLHPIKQKKMAFVLYNLMKVDMHLVISTHSDYLIKALINLMLEDKLNNTKNHPYDKVSAYLFKDGEIKKLGKLYSENFDFSNFDNTTDTINDEYFQLIEKLESKCDMDGEDHEH